MRAACSEHGRVASVMLKQGFAFVDFETTEGAEAARNALTGSVHRGRTLNVDFAGKPSRRDKGGGGNDDKRDMRSDTTGSFSTQGPRQAEGSSHSATRNLFVANIPSSMTEDDVKVYFKSCDGVQGNILNVKFLPKKSDTWAGFVDFEHMEDAIAVHQACAHAPPLPGPSTPEHAAPPAHLSRPPRLASDGSPARGQPASHGLQLAGASRGPKK